jgi:hypothetical protein
MNQEAAERFVEGEVLADHDLDAVLDSPAIARLIEEVRGTDFEVTRAYNRTYNRHNR